MEKEMRLEMRMREEAQMTLLHKAQKEEQRSKIAMNRYGHQEKIKHDVGFAKSEKQQTKELFYHQNNQHVAKATMIKQLIKSQQDEAREKKKQDLQMKKMRK